eukprot:TRINITY_DN709_c2_g1_i1.p1 TRINITY_DN709_c2_g1~~TRINITY_DN709_c2_g1_i1.p1  ORF type:complete len:299 (-),score=105.67 TRINITY_DN709_c2_g1_i1:264-1160(-)
MSNISKQLQTLDQQTKEASKSTLTSEQMTELKELFYFFCEKEKPGERQKDKDKDKGKENEKEKEKEKDKEVKGTQHQTKDEKSILESPSVSTMSPSPSLSSSSSSSSSAPFSTPATIIDSTTALIRPDSIGFEKRSSNPTNNNSQESKPEQQQQPQQPTQQQQQPPSSTDTSAKTTSPPAQERRITAQGFHQLLTKLGASVSLQFCQDRINSFAAEKDKGLSFEEFVVFYSNLTKDKTSSEEMKIVFDVLDDNDDQKISLDKFRPMMKVLLSDTQVPPKVEGLSNVVTFDDFVDFLMS